MEFAISKIFWFLFAPVNLLAILIAVAAFLLYCRPAWSQRLGRRLCLGLALVLMAMLILPLGAWMISPLENDFPHFAVTDTTPAPYGIIVLGGAVDPGASVAHGQPSLNEAAGRVLEFIALSKRFPDAKLVFTGGSGTLTDQEHREATAMKALCDSLGLGSDRVTYEDRSRNTYENATFSRDLMKPTPGQTWILITSAAHMPRSMAVFRHVGWNVIADPVDYRTDSMSILRPHFELVRALSMGSNAIREYIGLVAYRLMGYTDALWPAP